jgi:ABC-type sugar transport system substrate-binding protein
MGCVFRGKFLALISSGVLLLAGCARPPSLPKKAPALAAGEPPTITVIAGGRESYWKEARRGALAAGKKLGAKIVWKAPAGSDLIKSQQTLVTESLENSHGIVLAPLDSTKLMQSVGDAARAGLAVVVFDRDVFTVQNKLSFVHNDDEQSGVLRQSVKNSVITPDYYQMAYQSVKAIVDYRALQYPPREIKANIRQTLRSTHV